MVNFAAVVVAALVSIAIGIVWYSPGMLGKTWLKLIHRKKFHDHHGKVAEGYLANLVTWIIAAMILSVFIGLTGQYTVGMGALMGLLAWLGFTATTTINTVLWEDRKFNLYIINNVYYLISLVLTGIIVATWV